MQQIRLVNAATERLLASFPPVRGKKNGLTTCRPRPCCSNRAELAVVAMSEQLAEESGLDSRGIRSIEGRHFLSQFDVAPLMCSTSCA